MKIKNNLNNYRRDSYVGAGDILRQKYGITNDVEIDCDYGTSPFGQSPKVKQAILDFNYAASVHYFDPFHSHIKDVIINKFKDSGLTPDNIFFGHGSFNLGERIVHKLIEPTAMLGYGPQFNEIPTEMIAAGGSYHPVLMNLKDFRVPADEMINQLYKYDYSILYIDNPNNPTGQLTPLGELEKLVGAAQKNKTICLIDEAYGDFVSDSNSAFSLVNSFENLIVIRSLSKGMGLGSFRFGYAAFSKKLAEIYTQIDVPFEPSLICATAGKAALMDDHFIKNIRSKAKDSKQILTNGLEKLGIMILPTHPMVSICVAHLPDRDLLNILASKGIIAEAGEAYKNVCPYFDNSFVRIRIPFGKDKKTSSDMSHEIINRLEGAI